MIHRPLLLAALALPLTAQEEDEHAHVRQPLPSPEEIAQLPPDGGEEFNRLIFEQSPYLLQHARNPVDWYPWGEEAFRAAQAQNKPILLSIGYSTCHWCHVMEHESFEDEDVAKLLNEDYVPIKVDREERPDVDHVYMTVTQAMNQGRGGWPMTVLMTPDRKPFFAGTYFPKKGRYGRPGFIDLLQQHTQLWEEDRAKVVGHADQVAQAMQGMVAGSPGEALGVPVLDRAYQGLAQRYEPQHGGFGDAPKFPVPHNLRFLLRHHRRSGEEQALHIVTHTLREMRQGGIWDHVGFGFHRYSTDRRWLVPHFEKMLYDQALLTMAYLDAHQVTGEEEFARTAREVLTYLTRDMTSPEGGFYSAEDADSEGEEGLFYLWTREQLEQALEPDDAAWAAWVWNVTEEGNFREESSGAKTGRNILHLQSSYDELARERGVSRAEFDARLERIRERLFEVREPRVHPLKDDKILTDWNGLMIAAFAQAGRVLDDDGYRRTARRATDHLLDVLRRDDGGLYKLARLGQPKGEGLLEDYAFASLGLLEAFETLQEPRYLRAARELVEEMRERFHDAENGGFFLAPAAQADLIVRPKEVQDGAIPSGNSVAAWVLQRLGRLLGDPAYEDLAAETVAAFSGVVGQRPGLFTQLLFAVDFGVGPSHEVVVVGDPAAEDTRAMLRAVHEPYAPNKVVVLKPLGDASAITKLAPYVEPQTAVDGRATAYVCENYACQTPTTDPSEVRAVLSPPSPDAEGEAE